MKLNRKWLMVIALVLSLTMATAGTLAYLTDSDKDVNTMTLGRVEIVQNEQERTEDGELDEFTQDKPLLPAYPQYPQQNYPMQIHQQPVYGTVQQYAQQGYQQYPIQEYQQQPCSPQPWQAYQQPLPQSQPYQMAYSQPNYVQQTYAQPVQQSVQNPPFVQQWNDESSQADQRMNRTY